VLNLAIGREPGDGLRVLCLGAHGDDIELGCGGTMLRLAAEHPGLSVCWVVLSASGPRRGEAVASAAEFLRGAAETRVVVKEFRDGFFPYVGGEIKGYFEQLKREVDPDLILTHCRHDLHQDHRLVCELTWNTFRDHLILEYEIAKYDGDLGSPNLFVDLDEAFCHKKGQLLRRHFGSQRDKDWFAEDTFLALARLRGVESRAPSRYAEAFYCRKVILVP
jgi:LmbE family N-acetylglucosaminyl deacetylase